MEGAAGADTSELHSTFGPEAKKRLCLVLDTNQWITHLMLRSPTAAAILYSLRQQDGVLGLPHVVEEELKRHAVSEGRRARDGVISGLADLRRLLGSAPAPTLPGDAVLDAAAPRRLAELDSLLVRIPFTFEQAQRALRRVLDKIPPNGEKNQQYKDTLIWEAVLLLADNFDVVLVSSDRAFFANKEPSNGLAVELLEDTKATRCNISGVATLGEAAERIRMTEPPIDVEELTRLVDKAVRAELTSAAEKADFVVGALTDSELRIYATENPDVLAVTFDLTHALQDVRQPPRNHAWAVIDGDCAVGNSEVAELRPAKTSIDWVEPNGDPGHAGIVYGYAASHIGERHEPYIVRTEVFRRS